MNKLANWMAGLVLAASPWSAFADAQELTIFHTITIDAPAEHVWAMTGDVGGIQRWAPGTESSRLILHDRNETGCDPTLATSRPRHPSHGKAARL